MRQIICLSQSKWSKDPKRTQHLMRLLRDVEVTYFELTVTGDPTSYLRKRNEMEVREPHPGIKVYRVPAIFFWRTGSTPLERLSLGRAARAISRCVKDAGIQDALLWCATPVAAEMVQRIPHESLIYDCHRAWDNYPQRLESDLAFSADMVFAASENLLEHVLPCNRNSFLLANGVNYGLYARGGSKDTIPDPAFDGLRRPIFAYWGNVQRNIDLGPLLYTAKEHPEWSFVLIGRIRPDHPNAARLKRSKNIRCIGYRAPADVPACLAACDVCFDLRHNDIEDEDVIPERLYAYFAAEKPVACVYPRRYVPEFPDVVYGGQDREGFERACLKASNELGKRKRAIRGEYARRADWGARAELLYQILRENGMM